MADEQFTSDDPMILAGEYALRVLEGEELVAAQRLMLADPEFAEAVRWWESWLASMAEEAPPIAPSPRLWRAIEVRLDGRDDHEADSAPVPIDRVSRRAGPSGWSIIMAGTGVAAMIVAAFIAMPGTTQLPADGPSATQTADQLIAQLGGEEEGARLAGRVDPATGQFAIATAGFDDEDGQAPELWVIPEGGAPVSLGLIPAAGRHSRILTASERAMMVPGATLAVTMENRATAPHDAPTSDAVVAGALDLI